MIKKAGLAVFLSVACTGVSAGAGPNCAEGYLVGIESSRADNANGWAVWVSSKPYFDGTAHRYSSDIGGRLDLNKDWGRFTFSMAMNAMNMGHPVDVDDIYGSMFCDDFQRLEESNS
ncbi:hypothetical protein [Dyella choica]|uniref:Uncharacterized protein n=1 Tax=Dyella choica TaxID=1927959 RepID=A0A3S0R608_9GAMM|nr:hypothetical protein [Dyella choica]RUL79037.1 hypothetical protein EKH80_04360 [Dyella choica]